MKIFAALTLVSATAFAVSQTSHSDSAAMRLVRGAADSVSAALRSGKKVTISVDDRLTNYSPKLVGGRLLVPARLFNETGQRVIWTGADKRGIIRDDRDPRRTVEMDAREPKADRAALAMRPILKNGRLWIPLVPAIDSLGHSLTWVRTSNRLNISTNRSSVR